MSPGSPILVTGAAGRGGGVGGAVVEALRRRGLPVRALVRKHDERADALAAAARCPVLPDLLLTFVPDALLSQGGEG